MRGPKLRSELGYSGTCLLYVLTHLTTSKPCVRPHDSLLDALKSGHELGGGGDVLDYDLGEVPRRLPDLLELGDLLRGGGMVVEDTVESFFYDDSPSLLTLISLRPPSTSLTIFTSGTNDKASATWSPCWVVTCTMHPTPGIA